MGFTYNDIRSKDMGLKARLTSWQVCGDLRNFNTTIPGKYGVTDFGADLDYREISVSCNISPHKNFTSLVKTLDGISAWLDPTSLHQLIFDEVPDRYFMARLNAKTDCKRLICFAGVFDLKFFCPDPFGYAVEDETYSIAETDRPHTVTRLKGNVESLPLYVVRGISTPNSGSRIIINVNGTVISLLNAALADGEALMIDTDKMTAWVEDANGNTLRNGLPYMEEIVFPVLRPGDNTVSVTVQNAVFASLDIRARSRWR